MNKLRRKKLEELSTKIEELMNEENKNATEE